jgi:signal transduction histidine kinase
VLKPAGQDELLKEIEKTMADGRTWSGDILATTGDGKKLYVELVGAKVFDEKGEVFAALYMGRDVSEEKNIERQMIILERMATRGEMAAEIAHELNNYLSIVLGNLELLQMELEMGKTDKAPKKINSMKSGLDKITRFTDGLMMYSRPSTNKEEFDLHAFLESELYFIKTQNRFDNVDFEMDLDTKLPPITADKSQIQQALLNFLNNAADATAGNTGRRLITIITSYIKESESVSVAVKDNGVGLDEDSINRVFKQHFTTKEQGHGFGLLAVKRVIKCHAGKVMAENNPDSGAKFSIIFPIKQDENTINLI